MNFDHIAPYIAPIYANMAPVLDIQAKSILTRSFLSWFQIGWRFIANIFAVCLCKYFFANGLTQECWRIPSKCTLCKHKFDKRLWELWLQPSQLSFLPHAILKGNVTTLEIMVFFVHLYSFFFSLRMCGLVQLIKVGNPFWVEPHDSNTLFWNENTL